MRSKRTAAEFWTGVWLGIGLFWIGGVNALFMLNEQTGGALALKLWGVNTIHSRPRVILGDRLKVLAPSTGSPAPWPRKWAREPLNQGELARLASEIVLPPFGFSMVYLYPEPIVIEGRTWWRIEYDTEFRKFATSKPVQKHIDVCFSVDPEQPDNPDGDQIKDSKEIASLLGKSLDH